MVIALGGEALVGGQAQARPDEESENHFRWLT
jgi:hypothetical protein